jgi:hypothetical protein
MKNSLKLLLDVFVDKTISSSDIFNVLVENIVKLADESRKIADLAVQMNERLNKHEKAIADLYKLHKQTIIFDYAAKDKESSKPN